MRFLREILKFLAEYFVFIAGSLFIFAIGFVYALIRPEGFVFNLIFLIIAVGWIVFLIKYFWDILEKHKNSNLKDK